MFFNPVKLKWSIPSAPQHEHNNAPGISKDLPLYEALMARGYEDRATQCGMYLKLGSFIVPEDILDKETNANSKDYYITSYVPDLHTGLEATLAALQNPQWKKDIVTYVKVDAPLVVAVYGNEVVGFAGPIISQSNGRAFFAVSEYTQSMRVMALAVYYFSEWLKLFKMWAVNISLYSLEIIIRLFESIKKRALLLKNNFLYCGGNFKDERKIHSISNWSACW